MHQLASITLPTNPSPHQTITNQRLSFYDESTAFKRGYHSIRRARSKAAESTAALRSLSATANVSFVPPGWVPTAHVSTYFVSPGKFLLSNGANTTQLKWKSRRQRILPDYVHTWRTRRVLFHARSSAIVCNCTIPSCARVHVFSV